MPPRRGRSRGPLTNAALACPGRTSDRGGAAVARAGGAVLGRRLAPRSSRPSISRSTSTRSTRYAARTRTPGSTCSRSSTSTTPARRSTSPTASRIWPSTTVGSCWLLAPAVALWPLPETMMVAQVLALALSGDPAVPVLARACGATGHDRPPHRRGVAWSQRRHRVSRTAGSHPNTSSRWLASVSLALAARRRSLLGDDRLAAQLLLGIKEDEAWFLAWLGGVSIVF